MNTDDANLVGRPLKAHFGVMLVVINCLCKPDNPPMLIRGTDQSVWCGNCRKIYQIINIEYNYIKNKDTGPLVKVGLMGLMPEEKVKDTLLV
jgi:hypothetical protein